MLCIMHCAPAGVESEDSLGASTVSGKVTPWLQQTLQGMGSGLRRFDKERVVGFVNYVSSGIVSGPKMLYTIEAITQLAHSHPRTFIGLILLPNRSGDLRTTSVKQLG